MEIRLEKLGASAFTLELPANVNAPDRLLSLDTVAGLGGSLHTEPGLLRLAGARAEAGTINRLSWLIAGVEVKSEAPIEVGELRLDSTHATGGSDTPLAIDAKAASIGATSLAINGPTFRATSDLTAAEASLLVDSGETSFEAQTMRGKNLQLHAGSVFLRAALSLASVRVRGGSGLQLAASRIGADSLRLETGRVIVDATDVELASGLAIKDGEVRIDAARFGELSVTIGLAAASEPADPDPDRPRLGMRDDVVVYGDRSLFDLRDLDRFTGSAKIGVFVKAQLPVVGNYRLERTFKVPISDGSIDFVELERQLGTIEDAFIDFAVRDGELVLKRDIPLLPTRGKVLVRWPLSNVEQALAKSRLIRLRALSRYQVEKAKAGDKKATIGAVKVDVSHFEVSLPAASDEQGDAWGVVPAELHIRSIDKLSIGGSMFLNASADAGSRELGAALRAEGLRLQIASLPLSERHLFAQAVSCGELEISVPEWDAFRPLAVTIKARDVVIERAGLRTAPPSDGQNGE